MIKNKKQAFSLIEAMISLLILSVILALAFPVLTKNTKVQNNKMHSAVFLYDETSSDSDDACYLTTVGTSAVTVLNSKNTGNCTKYTFTVPQGVNSVDLALVAGGGGGGGAAGSYEIRHTYENKGLSSSVTVSNIYPTRIRDVVIDYLATKGNSDAEETCVQTQNGQSGVCSSKGGTSGTGLSDYKIPSRVFVNSALKDVKESDNISLIFSLSANPSPSISFFHGSPGLSYFKFGMGINGGTKGLDREVKVGTSESEITKEIKSILEANEPTVVHDIKGKTESLTVSNDMILMAGSNYGQKKNVFIVPSGKGGVLNPKYRYGEGEDGDIMVTNCQGVGDGLSSSSGSTGTSSSNTLYLTACGSSSTFTFKRVSPPSKENVNYARSTITVEHPPGIGNGGAGGTALRVFNFKVTPGETYTILVGKGGTGGLAGKKGQVVDDIQGDSPTYGADGASGSSTAIVDSSGNIVYLVAGGAGGVGGVPNYYANQLNGKSFVGYGGSNSFSRSAPLVLSAVRANIDSGIIDNDYNGVVTPGGSAQVYRLENLAGNSAGIVMPQTINSRRIPFYQLIYNNNKDYSTDTREKYKTGGFNNFVSKTDSTAITTDGFYFRSYLGDNLSYAGGLGGFSGLNTKAGCGGLYLGNNSSQFTIYKDFSQTGSSYLYNVNEYYSNCSSSTPDGHTAEFIPPSAVNYGQAGAGGGGGGYSMALGSGNGGDGQNGYVMIRWKK